jgi:hypothetical protein
LKKRKVYPNSLVHKKMNMKDPPASNRSSGDEEGENDNHDPSGTKLGASQAAIAASIRVEEVNGTLRTSIGDGVAKKASDGGEVTGEVKARSDAVSEASERDEATATTSAAQASVKSAPQEVGNSLVDREAGAEGGSSSEEKKADIFTKQQQQSEPLPQAEREAPQTGAQSTDLPRHPADNDIEKPSSGETDAAKRPSGINELSKSCGDSDLYPPTQNERQHAAAASQVASLKGGGSAKSTGDTNPEDSMQAALPSVNDHSVKASSSTSPSTQIPTTQLQKPPATQNSQSFLNSQPQTAVPMTALPTPATAPPPANPAMMATAIPDSTVVAQVVHNLCALFQTCKFHLLAS